jgi:hypothetical protein
MVCSSSVVATAFHEVVIGTGGRNLQVGVNRSLEGMPCNWPQWVGSTGSPEREVAIQLVRLANGSKLSNTGPTSLPPSMAVQADEHS